MFNLHMLVCWKVWAYKTTMLFHFIFVQYFSIVHHVTVIVLIRYINNITIRLTVINYDNVEWKIPEKRPIQRKQIQIVPFWFIEKKKSKWTAVILIIA